MSALQEAPSEQSPSIIRDASLGGLSAFMLSILTDFSIGSFPLDSLNNEIVTGVVSAAGVVWGGSHAYFVRRRQKREQRRDLEQTQRIQALNRKETLENSFLTHDDIEGGIRSLENFVNMPSLNNISDADIS